MPSGPTTRRVKPKNEIEALLLEAVRKVAGDAVQRVQITRADPALYGANWSATSLSGAGTKHSDEDTILRTVTLLQGKFDADWD